MAGSAANVSAAEYENMSPREREAHLVELAEEGVGSDHFLFGTIQRMIAASEARDQARDMSSANIRNHGRDVEYVRGVNPSDAHYPGIAHDQLKNYATVNNNPGDVGAISDDYHAMSRDLEQIAETLAKAISKSQSTWEGEAADAARTFMTKISEWSQTNSSNAKLASETVYAQGTAAEVAKNSMPDPIPFSWGEEIKSWGFSTPMSLPSKISDSFQKQAESQEAHDQAARVLTTQDSETYVAASKQPTFPDPPKFETGGTGTDGRDGSGGIRGGGSGVGVGTGTAGGTNTAGFTGGSGVRGYTPPGGGTAGNAGGTSPGGGIYTPPLQPGRQMGSAPPGGTRAAAFSPGRFTPGRAKSGARSDDAAAAGGFGAMPVGGVGGGASGGEYAPRGGGAGSGTAAPGAGARMSGAGQPGPVGGPSAAGAAAAAAAGRGGTGAGGMMGAGAGRGQGDDDKEHQRKYGMDSDEAFRPELDDEGGVLRDPATGMPVVPPVIGE